MYRALFEKTGNGIWISHLDLMRLFQRAFKRAGLTLTHTQGFNPRPSVSIALPLSVGVESYCELLDFDLEGMAVSCDEICRRLNENLTEGIRVHSVYKDAMKIRDLAYLECKVLLNYDGGITREAETAINELFNGQSLVVPKKGKNGVQDQDILPMIRKMEIARTGESALEIKAIICCQNPSLNPMQIPAAISLHLPEYTPDYTKCYRFALFDAQMHKFR